MGYTSHDDEILARKGHLTVDGTGAITNTPHYGFQQTEDTVIAVWKTYDSEGNEYDQVALFGISGKTITTEDPSYVVPPEQRSANKHNFQLTSGAGKLLKK